MITYNPTTKVCTITTDRYRQVSAHVLADRLKDELDKDITILEIRHTFDSVIDTLIIKINTLSYSEIFQSIYDKIIEIVSSYYLKN